MGMYDIWCRHQVTTLIKRLSGIQHTHTNHFQLHRSRGATVVTAATAATVVPATGSQEGKCVPGGFRVLGRDRKGLQGQEGKCAPERRHWHVSAAPSPSGMSWRL
eukprot:365887-Chlamydomonas_euryale.AAC.4